MKNQLLVILLSPLIVFAQAQQPQSSSSKKLSQNRTSEQAKVVINTLKITKNKNQFYVSLNNTKILNWGKSFPRVERNWEKNDFVCFILDANKKTLDTVLIRQPLNGRYEFPKDDGTIGSTAKDLAENELLIRFRYRPEMAYMSVVAVGEKSRLIIVDTIELLK